MYPDGLQITITIEIRPYTMDTCIRKPETKRSSSSTSDISSNRDEEKPNNSKQQLRQ